MRKKRPAGLDRLFTLTYRPLGANQLIPYLDRETLKLASTFAVRCGRYLFPAL